MRMGRDKLLGILAVLAIALVALPAGAQASRLTVETSYLTLADSMGVDNRISAFTDPTGRLVLTAPEGLGDPDRSGTNCALDNAKTGEDTATQVSCAPGYIVAIVGDLGRGNDIFDADPSLSIPIGVLGESRPLSGGPGRDRLVGGAAQDLLDGEGGPDTVVGGDADDFLTGGPGADSLSGGLGADSLFGLGGPDRLSGGAGQDSCRGGAEIDVGRRCELSRGIP